MNTPTLTDNTEQDITTQLEELHLSANKERSLYGKYLIQEQIIALSNTQEDK